MSALKQGDHLYLVDGSGYLFRAYHALPPLTRKSDGLPVGAVSGYCNMLWKLLEEMRGGDAPTHLAVINDSASHSGHLGDDGTGESHFTVEIESAAFAGVSRLQRQRLVNQALGDLPGQRVHALAIRARAPGE